MAAIGLRSLLLLSAAVLAGCGPARQEGVNQKMTKRSFGKLPSGEEIDLYTMSNAKGMQVAITNYGARVVSLMVPDKSGRTADVVLGFDSLEGYVSNNPYFGAIVGRYGNRIAKGRFKLNGVEYVLARNDGENSLHGGIKGFDKVAWTARDVSSSDTPALELTYTSKDGEEGYPGNLTTVVTYTLTPDSALKIDYRLTTDKDTVANVTNHSYFNLKGAGNGDVLNHVVEIRAGRFTPVDSGLIPTGELKSVEGTPFDFRKPTAIGARINNADEQLKLGRGYDHNFVLDSGGALALAARVTEPESGRVMEVLTTEPGMQFYTGNFLDGTIRGTGGKVYGQRYGFCMETQHYPDTPNHPAFPSAVVKPGAGYSSTTVFRFSAP